MLVVVVVDPVVFSASMAFPNENEGSGFNTELSDEPTDVFSGSDVFPKEKEGKVVLEVETALEAADKLGDDALDVVSGSDVFPKENEGKVEVIDEAVELTLETSVLVDVFPNEKEDNGDVEATVLVDVVLLPDSGDFEVVSEFKDIEGTVDFIVCVEMAGIVREEDTVTEVLRAGRKQNKGLK